MPALVDIERRAREPISLSSALCRPTSSRTCRMRPSGSAQAAAWVEPAAAFIGWPCFSEAKANRTEAAEQAAEWSSGVGVRRTSSSWLAPQMPQPLRPGRLRPLLVVTRTGASLVTVMASSMPSRRGRTSTLRSWAGSAISPSVSEKPRAKSSRFAGLDIITENATSL
ncbi:hypothetical protein D3C73_1151000 [compost metagenome]